MWRERLASAFEPAVRRRGAQYAADGLVTDLRIGDDDMTSVVVGSDVYDVRFRRSYYGRACLVDLSCTCPYGGPCKHAWATVLEAGPALDARWGAAPTDVGLSFNWGDGEDEEEDPIGREVTPTRSRNSSKKEKPSREQKPRTPKKEWRRLLQDAKSRRWAPLASSVPPAAPLEGRLWYVVDVGQSREASGLVVVTMQEGRERPAATNHTEDADATEGPRKLRKQALLASDVDRLENADDRTIMALLMGAARPTRDTYAFEARYPHQRQASSLWKIDPSLLGVVMPLLQQTGRLRWRRENEHLTSPLHWNGESAWKLLLDISAANDVDHVLIPRLKRGGLRPAIGEVHFAWGGTPGLVLHGDELAPLHASHYDVDWAKGLLHRAPVRVEREDLLELLNEANQSGLEIDLEWPDGWGVRVIEGVAPTGRLVLSTRANDYIPAQTGHLFADVQPIYGSSAVEPTSGPLRSATMPDGGPGLVRRDHQAEQRLLARVASLGLRRDSYAQRWLIPQRRLPELVGQFAAEGWEVLGEKGAYRVAGEMRIAASSGIDWFEVHGTVAFGESSASIAAVLDALKSGQTFVNLSDGSLGMLPERWLERHGRWLGMGATTGDVVRFSKAQLSLVDLLLAETPDATCDAQVTAARKRLRSFDGIPPRKEPRGFKGELRPYQRQALGWMRFLDEFGFGGCLADDMGLGKTVQLLAHVLDQRAKGSRGAWLVVAPKSLVFNWAREAERFAPKLRVVTHVGGDRGDGAETFANADLVLTTYSTMRLDIELLRSIEFDCVVLDEAQAIKNATSQAAKAARLLNTRRRLALTGTPVENRLDDLWSIFEFLNPGMLGSLKAFQNAMRGGNAAAKTTADVSSRPEEDRASASSELRRLLRPFMLRRTKAAVAPELPSRSEQVVACELEGKQKTLYESLRSHYQAQLLGRVQREGIQRSKMHVLEALLRLRQAACHPGLIEPKNVGAPSAKFQALIDMLEELTSEGHKALVFSQFTSLLALLQRELDERRIAYEYLDGKTAAADRAKAVDRFQSAESRGVFLISLKAGGTGLNLTAAGYVFLLDPWWNPAVEAQAIDRTHRIGQDKSVLAYRLIARGTVEERILELQRSKRELANAIVAEDSGPLASMTAEDLAWLLS